MGRETTIKLEFELQNPADDMTLTLETPGITVGATTQLHTDPDDPAWDEVPAVIAVGRYIALDDTGSAKLDKKLHLITAIDSVTGIITLATNTTGETGLAAFGDMEAIVPGWTHVCLSEFTPNVGAPGEVDATTMCDEERVNLPGLASPGTATYGGPFDMEDEGMLAMRDANDDAIPRYMVAKTRRGQIGIFHGVVSAFSMGALTVEAVVPFTGSFTMDRKATYAVAA